VDNLEAAYQALLARGVEFVSAPHIIAEMETVVVWMAFFHDSEGNLLSLMSDVPR
jgi:methylmalonyl-CoA/ethylmalonyl-CoA epimerase